MRERASFARVVRFAHSTYEALPSIGFVLHPREMRNTVATGAQAIIGGGSRTFQEYIRQSVTTLRPRGIKSPAADPLEENESNPWMANDKQCPTARSCHALWQARIITRLLASIQHKSANVSATGVFRAYLPARRMRRDRPARGPIFFPSRLFGSSPPRNLPQLLRTPVTTPRLVVLAANPSQ